MEQIAENKAIKKAEFMASPAGERWLIGKWIIELSDKLSQCKTTLDKEKVLVQFKARGLKQNQFINNMISHYDPASTTIIMSSWLGRWINDNPDLAKPWCKANPDKVKDLIKVMSDEDFDFKVP